MSTYNLNLTLENIRTISIMFLDIFIMWLVLYYAIKIVRSNSRTIQIFKGILLILIIDSIAKFLGLKTLAYLTDIFINWGFLAVIIIFQPEIRSLLERLGKSNVFSRITTLTGDEKEKLVDNIVTAAMLLSEDQTGALICIEQSHSLDDYIATGTKLNSDVTAELLTSIFVTSTPLHDGAVIIQGDKIACASAYFPPTNLDLPSRYGARHRAAIGISEITDAVTIVISEETGAISITEGGKIFQVDRKQLRDYLLRVICGATTEVQVSQRKRTAVPDRTIVIDDGKKPANPDAYEIETDAEKKAAAEKEKQALKRQDTGMLSKLAIKKQDTGETPKIEAEEIRPAAVEQPKEDIRDARQEKKHHFSLFGNNERNSETTSATDGQTKIRELEKEAAEIKMPKKKDRPQPSYPENAAGQRFEDIRTTVKAREDRAAEVLPQPGQASADVQPVSPIQKQTAAEETKEPVKVYVAPAMTSEQVRAAREKNKEMFRSAAHSQMPNEMPVDTKKITPSMHGEDTGGMAIIDKKKLAEDSKIYDTSKLDISKIIGLESDLDKTFEMVDNLKDISGKKKPDDATSEKKGGHR